jgi:lytic murein transglycosylase
MARRNPADRRTAAGLAAFVGRSGLAASAAWLAILLQPALADTSCRGGQSFAAWLADFRRVAEQQGISPRALTALDGIAFDDRVLAQDRGQPTLSQSFADYAARAISSDRLQRGRSMLETHRTTLANVERDFGVPGAVVVALWGLESDYGAFMGSFPLVRSLATLAYDCRRPEHFATELTGALRLIDAGHVSAAEMVGSWAGALGQVQFTPTNYLAHAVDYDRDGRRNLVGSVPDVVASAANYLRALGWRAGEPWLEEVRVGEGVPWQESARAIRHPRSAWAAFGVRRVDGEPLPADGVPAALILPMGRLGPAFLAYANFDVFWEWNQSSNYSLAAAYFATRLAGSPAMQRGSAPPILGAAEMREVQERLNARGYAAGSPDGRLGELTRAGVKQAQLAFGLPADGYPTRELLERLRR